MGWIIAIVVIVVAVVLFVKWNKKQQPQGSETNQNSKKDNTMNTDIVGGAKETENNIDSKQTMLLQINLLVREDSEREEDVVELVENIIDNLLKVIGKLNSKHPDSELTFVMNKVVDEYLLKTIQSYLALSAEQRKAKKGKLIESLTELKERVDSVVEKVERQDASTFNTEAQFMKGMIKTA